MKKSKLPVIIEDTFQNNKVHLIRGELVVLDKDLAQFFGIETKVLNRSLKRNQDRFPQEMIFQLTKEEALRCQNGTLENGKNIKYLPHVFTEQGVWGMSFLLNSPRAKEKSVELLRIFKSLRDSMLQMKNLPDNTQKILASSTVNIFSGNVQNLIIMGSHGTVNQNFGSEQELISYFEKIKPALDENLIAEKLEALIQELKKGKSGSIKETLDTTDKALSVINNITPALTAIKAGIVLAKAYFGF